MLQLLETAVKSSIHLQTHHLLYCKSSKLSLHTSRKSFMCSKFSANCMFQLRDTVCVCVCMRMCVCDMCVCVCVCVCVSRSTRTKERSQNVHSVCGCVSFNE